jgi:hypothetical protein
VLDLAAAAGILDRPEMPNQPLDGHARLPRLRERRSSLVGQLTSEWDFMRSPCPSSPCQPEPAGARMRAVSSPDGVDA